MNKKELVMLIMAKKTLDYQKDPNPENWVTISGAKVHLDEGGKIDGGAKGKFNGKSYSGTKKQTGTTKPEESAEKKAPAETPKTGEPKADPAEKSYLREKNDDFYKKQAQATMRHSLREHHMENTTANKREIADDVRRDIEYRAERWKQHYEAAKSDPNCSKQRLEGLKEQSDDAQKELEWFNKLYPKADKTKKPRRKPGDPIDVPMEKRDEIVKYVLKDENRAKSFIGWATKVINEYNETYGRNRVNYEVSKVDLEDVVPLGKDKAYVTLHFNVKDKNGKGPQRGAAQTFLLKDMTREERKLYFGK